MEEFCAVQGSENCGTRVVDGLIIKGGVTKIVRKPHDASLIKGKDVVVVQAKARRLGMSLMGQVVFSVQLMKKFKPRSIEAVALATRDDAVLRPILERRKGMRVVIYTGKKRKRRERSG